MSCKVKDCKYSSEHVTSIHICSTCYTSGHGKHECGNIMMTNELKQYYNDTIDSPCKFIGSADERTLETQGVSNLGERAEALPCTNIHCNNIMTHTTKGHLCIFCNKYGSKHMKKCPEMGVPIVDNINNKDLIIKSDFLKPGEYYEIYNGMNCYTYVRRNIDTNNIESIFMHKNNWELCDEDISDAPRYRAFIYKYTLFRKVF